MHCRLVRSRRRPPRGRRRRSFPISWSRDQENWSRVLTFQIFDFRDTRTLRRKPLSTDRSGEHTPPPPLAFRSLQKFSTSRNAQTKNSERTARFPDPLRRKPLSTGNIRGLYPPFLVLLLLPPRVLPLFNETHQGIKGQSNRQALTTAPSYHGTHEDQYQHVQLLRRRQQTIRFRCRRWRRTWCRKQRQRSSSSSRKRRRQD